MEFEIKCWQDWGSDNLKIIVFDRSHKDSRVVNFYTGECKVLKEYEQIPEEFMMKMPRFCKEPFFKALAEALDSEGIKTDNDHKIQGTLEATKYHLEDLRKIVFK